MDSQKTVVVTDSNIEQFNSGRALLFFSAEWHEPCAEMVPIIERVAQEFAGKVAVGRVEIYDQPAIASAHRISRIPTLKFVKAGRVTTTHSGTIEESVLLEVMNKFAA